MKKRLGNISAQLCKMIFDNGINPYQYISSVELALDRISLDRLSNARVALVVAYAYNNCRFYRKLYDDCGFHPNQWKSLETIEQLPLVTHQDLRSNLDLISAVGVDRRRWTKSSTGGTTSSPISFYRDRNTTLRRLADTAATDCWYGRNLGDRVAYLWGAPQDFSDKPSIAKRLRNISYLKTIMLPSSPLDDESMNLRLQQLDRWRPLFLQAYPTPLYELCLYLKRNDKSMPYLRNASVTAEPLYDHHRELIESVLGFKIFNWYGSREFGRVASECEHHDGLHINEPSVYVEIMPDPTLPKAYGHLVITDLWNRASPLIRYRTGDIARYINDTCKCGRALKRIEGIEGRLVDTIVLLGGRKIPGVTLTNRVIKDCDEIAELQVVQRTLDAFVLRYVKGPSFHSGSLETVRNNLLRLLDAEAMISYEEVMELPRSASGKSRFVISEVSMQDQVTASRGVDSDQIV